MEFHREPGPISRYSIAPVGRFFRRRWNETYYGFPDGKEPRERMAELLKQDPLGNSGARELLSLCDKTPSSYLRLQMAEKIERASRQLTREITESIALKGTYP